MAKIVVVTSGKGGVGKTTTSASFATGLALKGFKTAVIDFDVGLRNLDLIMGCERRVVYDLINVIQGEANLNQALIKDKQCDNLFVLAASQTRDKDALHQDGVEKVLNEGDIWHNPPMMPHQLIAMKPNSMIFEVSTADSVEDNYRIIPGDSQNVTDISATPT